MESNEGNRQFGERTADSVQIGLRVPKPLRDSIRATARENGRAMTAEFEAVVADGLRFREMLGDKTGFLKELFAAVIGAPNESVQAAAILRALERHLRWGTLLNAMMQLEHDHVAANPPSPDAE